MDDLLLPIFILLLCGCASGGNQYMASNWQDMSNESIHSFMGDSWSSNRYTEFSHAVRCSFGKSC